MKKKWLCLVAILCLLGAAGAAQADLFSGFDSSTEGWTTEGATAPTHVASGGNPGGYIKAQDNATTWWRFVAPDSWDGNWSGYYNGKLAFDLQPFDKNADQYNHYVEIWSGSHYAYWWQTAVYPPKGTWTHFEVQLNASNFTAVGDSLANILNHVTALKILGDIVNGFDTTGLDNVRVCAPVPLPGAFWLFGAGLLGLAGGRRLS